MSHIFTSHMNCFSVAILVFIRILLIHQAFFYVEFVESHGRLLEPPARNTLWRFGYKSAPNYNDNELFCGGIGGITRNNGKCGICGDPYDGYRQHETGQAMAINLTTRNFFPGSSIDLMIEIVANHGGRFKFEMCWRDSWEIKETEDCFEPLKLSSRSGKTKSWSESIATTTTQIDPLFREGNEIIENEEDKYYYELDPAAGTGIFTMSVELPFNRTCENCIFRWHWKSANNWGVCEDGSERVGCGYQEIYRNCADVSVKRNGAGIGLGLSRKKR